MLGCLPKCCNFKLSIYLHKYKKLVAVVVMLYYITQQPLSGFLVIVCVSLYEPSSHLQTEYFAQC